MTLFFLMLTVALLVFRRPIATWWKQLSFAPGNVAIFVVLLLLLFVTEPETRAILVAIDYIGADIFLILLFFQGREIFVWSWRVVWQPALRLLETWSWWPLPLPNWALFKQHPGWSALAVAQASFVTVLWAGIVAGVAVSIPGI
jgi:hypothetical protein